MHRREKDSTLNGDIFYTYSAYEMKNLLIQCEDLMRVLIFPQEFVVEDKSLYAATSSSEYIHMDLVLSLRKAAIVKSTGKVKDSHLVWFPGYSYNDVLDYYQGGEFISNRKEAERGLLENYTVYETKFGYLILEKSGANFTVASDLQYEMNEDTRLLFGGENTDEQIGADFCTKIMGGRKI